MYDAALSSINDAQKIVVVQAENPDGDSLGSALALEELLGDLGKAITLYCPVEIPKYLRYFNGWDRVVAQYDTTADVAIIVDTSADVLLGKVLDTPGIRHHFESHPVIVIDHHSTESTLSFEHTAVFEQAAATSEILLRMAESAGWSINAQAAEHLLGSQLSDTLGLSTPNVTSQSFQIAGRLVEHGAHPSVIDERRREYMKKSPEILAYKAELIQRIEYFLDGKLAVVHVPWNEIEKHSDKYNPGALIGDELRMVENVALGVVMKTYPDGRITGRLRGNLPIAETVAGYFGGGGHPYAAGFRVYEEYDRILHELIGAVSKALDETHETA